MDSTCVQSSKLPTESEDNSGALEFDKVPKMRPRTKHINIKHHHFRDFVDRGEISIHTINTKDQPANIMLTKPLNEAVLSKHQKAHHGLEH